MSFIEINVSVKKKMKQLITVTLINLHSYFDYSMKKKDALDQLEFDPPAENEAGS